jgi:hypothetical protein
MLWFPIEIAVCFGYQSCRLEISTISVWRICNIMFPASDLLRRILRIHRVGKQAES